MKKKKFLLYLFAIGSFALAACNDTSSNTPDKPKEEEKEEEKQGEEQKVYYKVKLYEGTTVVEEQKVEKDKKIDLSKHTKTGYETLLYNTPTLDKDELFDSNTAITSELELFIGYKKIDYKITYDVDGGTAIADKTFHFDEHVTLPYAEKTGYIFEGWYDGETLVPYIPEGTTKNISLKAKYVQEAVQAKSFKFLADDFDSGQLTNEKTSIYKVSGEIRPRIATWTNPTDSNDKITFERASIKNPAIEFKSPGAGKAYIYVQNGSGGASTQTIKIIKNGTGQDIEFAGSSAYGGYPSGSPIVRLEINLSLNDEIKISSGSGTRDVWMVDVQVDVPTTKASGIKVDNPGNNIIYEGQEYSTEDLAILTENGNYVEALDKKYCYIDTSEVDTKTPGTYDVKINYYGFETSYKVNVYEAKELVLGFDETYNSRNSYNGIYANGKVKTIYKLNDALDTKYLTTIANTKLSNKSKTFIIDDENVTYSSVDTSTAGKKTVTVSTIINGKTLTATYDINVVDTTPYKDTNNNYVVSVDKAYTGTIGAVDGTKGNMFTTIGQALEFLARTEDTSKKILNVSKGLYKEKIEVTIPNLTIIGAGSTKQTDPSNENYSSASYNNATIIEWDSLVGVPDASGYYQVTDSTATVAIRESATNCTIKNITLSNYWNCEERFAANSSLLTEYGLGGNEHRALALIVQADKFIMENSSLIGYQDTVEFMTGRQYIKNSYIAGITDFIFGTNSTTYFYGCEIHVIYNKNESGYTTAYKGTNGTGTEITYGLIFDHCTYTADSTVVNGSISLGRPWGDKTKVMIMNSTMDTAAISTVASSGVSSKERYVSMSGVNSYDTNVKFLEYNNSGASAISSSMAGVTVVDATTAANYSNFSIIFGKTNGNWEYDDAWNPTK